MSVDVACLRVEPEIHRSGARNSCGSSLESQASFPRWLYGSSKSASSCQRRGNLHANVGIAIINHPPNHHKWVVYTIKHGWFIIAILTFLHSPIFNVYRPMTPGSRWFHPCPDRKMDRERAHRDATYNWITNGLFILDQKKGLVKHASFNMGPYPHGCLISLKYPKNMKRLGIFA